MKKVTKEKQLQKRLPPEKTKERSRHRARFFSSCRTILCSPYTVAGLAFLCLIMVFLCFFSMHRLYTELYDRINERITEEVERNIENMALIENNLLNRTAEAEQTLLTALDDSKEETLRIIRRLDITYQSLLDAQKRRTLESLYKEDALAEDRREAAAAFAASRYVTASRLYGEIATAHPEDQEARFYQYYALFLSNKQNRDNYRVIQEAMNLLERHGYTRRELTETLQFIDDETERNEDEQ